MIKLKACLIRKLIFKFFYSVSRRVTEENGTSRTEEKNLSVKINPGWCEGTKITFHKEGDQVAGAIPADIVFTLKDKPHKHFKRENKTDIRYTAKITLREALCGTVVFVPTLSSAQFKLTVHKIITPNMIKRIPNEGLPNSKQPEKRGDLIVMFEIQFPNDLNEEKKQLLWDILP